MSYRILGAPISPFVRKTRVFCAEKGIAYELEPVSPFSPPEGFGAISPLGRIPVLAIEEDGALHHLPDSSVICDYLEHRHPTPALYPETPLERARALWLEEYCDTALAEVIGRGVFRPVVLARLAGGQPDREAAARAVEESLPKHCDYLESAIGDREFLVGNSFSIADIAATTSFVNLELAGFSVDAARWPRLGDFLERMRRRESFAGCFEDEQRLMTALGLA